MLVTRDPTFSPFIFLKKSSADVLKNLFQGKETGLYDYGRTAMGEGLDMLGLSSQDTILVPDYICVEAMEPIWKCGLNYQYYPIRIEGLKPDFGRLASLMKGHVKALLLIHYFGFENCIETVLQMCKKNNVVLIEDCAHSFLSRYRSRLLGTFGDMGLYSFHKLLPSENGGALCINEDKMNKRIRRKNLPALSDDLKIIFASCLRHLETNWGIPVMDALRFKNKIFFPYGNEKPYTNEISEKTNLCSISKLALKIFSLGGFDNIVERRRENYAYLANKIKEVKQIKPIFPLFSGGVCPQVFPAIAKDRDELIEYFLKNNIEAYKWPVLPEDVVGTEYKDALFLEHHLLALPIHQTLKKHHLDFMAHTLKRFYS